MVDETRTDSAEELEHLRAENAALKEQVAVAERSQSNRSAKMRNGFSAAILLLASLALALAIPAIWVNRMVTSTDYYVATVAPLARDAAIQDAVASAASDAVVKQLDLTTRLQSRLPTDLAFLAAPISSAADGFVHKQATTFVRSDAFPKVWDQINTVGHKTFVAAVTGKQTGAVQLQAGTLTLDLGVLADKIVEQLSASGFALANKVPTAALDRTFTLYHSDTLAQASALVDAVQRAALVLPLLGLALAAGAIALAVDRRRSLLWLGWGLLVWTLLPLQAIYVGQSYVGRQLLALASIPTDAARNAYAIIFSGLIGAERVFVLVSVLVIVGAMVAGPSKWATAVRSGVGGGISGVSAHLDLGAFGHWVSTRMQALRVVGYLSGAAMLVFLPTPRTISQVVWIAVWVLAWLLLVQVAGSGSTGDGSTAEHPAEPEPDETVQTR